MMMMMMMMMVMVVMVVVVGARFIECPASRVWSYVKVSLQYNSVPSTTRLRLSETQHSPNKTETPW